MTVRILVGAIIISYSFFITAMQPEAPRSEEPVLTVEELLEKYKPVYATPEEAEAAMGRLTAQAQQPTLQRLPLELKKILTPYLGGGTSLDATAWLLNSLYFKSKEYHKILSDPEIFTRLVDSMKKNFCTTTSEILKKLEFFPKSLRNDWKFIRQIEIENSVADMLGMPLRWGNINLWSYLAGHNIDGAGSIGIRRALMSDQIYEDVETRDYFEGASAVILAYMTPHSKCFNTIVPATGYALAKLPGFGSRILESLLYNGASVNARDEEGQTALMNLAKSNSDAIRVAIGTLTREYGADKALQDIHGNTAYDIALANPNLSEGTRDMLQP